jgi:nitrous oxidase accessory protein
MATDGRVRLARLATMLVLVASGAGVARAQSEILVSPAGPVTRIADAVRAAEPGDRIRIAAGVYREPTIVVDKRLTLVGDGWPVIDGEGARALLHITADDVEVRGLVFRNVGTSFREDRSAVRVTEAARCTIADNRFIDAFFGIYLAKARDCRIANNVLRGTGASQTFGANGIHLWYSSDVTIADNDVFGHRDGIYLEFSHRVAVERNRSTGNRRYGLHFMYSDDCVYRGNEFSDNDAGVAVMYAARVEIADNVFSESRGSATYGLLLKDISDVRLERNRFFDNTTALLVDNTTRLFAVRNRFDRNGWAIRLGASAQETRFEGNVFTGNTFDVSTNSTRTAATFDGNYWDRYAGYDLDRDGVGDVPHRPVRLFAVITERFEPSIVLLGSLFVQLLEAAERLFPSLTPVSLFDASPAMRPIPPEAA